MIIHHTILLQLRITRRISDFSDTIKTHWKVDDALRIRVIEHRIGETKKKKR